jgi:hypothetical protein
MPVILKEVTRQYEVVCDECGALIGFTEGDVDQLVRRGYDDSVTVTFVCCPKCKNKIELPENYRKKLKSTEV